MTLVYERHADESEKKRLAELLSWSFGHASPGWHRFLELAGDTNIRRLKAGKQLIGGLIHIPMGQFFGGRVVPMVGVAGVGIDPAFRNRGLARHLLEETIRELSEQNVALSTLFPATHRLYRSVGYERAGSHSEVRIPVAALSRVAADLETKAYRPSMEGEVRALYRQVATARSGWLDRTEYIWERTRRMRGDSRVRGHVFAGPSGLEAYLFARPVPTTGTRFDLLVTDHATITRAGANALGTFMHGHSSLVDHFVLRGDRNEPLLHLIEEPAAVEIKTTDHWMLRIVSLKAALETRGYPRGLTATLDLEIEDPLLPTNSGRFTLKVRSGRARLSRGGRGSVRLDIRALAALYTGHLSATALASLGRLVARNAIVPLADAVFHGVPPSLPDLF